MPFCKKNLLKGIVWLLNGKLVIRNTKIHDHLSFCIFSNLKRVDSKRINLKLS